MPDMSNMFFLCSSLKELNLAKFNTSNVTNMKYMFSECHSLQKRMNLNINDYERYSALYSSIEIELKPVNNEYGKFINIPESEKEYYHIYFNDKKQEIKRNYFNKEDKINKIKIKIDYQAKSFKELFDCSCAESIYFKKFYMNNITDMKYMFYKCSSLKELNLLNFNTINVTDMSYMFYNCSSLNELNLSNFNTINVIDMRDMFYKCSSLIKLNLSSFNTNNVTNMSSMFYSMFNLIYNKIK